MFVKRCSLFSVIMVSIFLFTYSAHPATKDEIESLKGLTGVLVLVEEFRNEIKKELPFDENQIRVDVELKLRTAGIKVFSKEEMLKTPRLAYLYINLDRHRITEMPMFYFSIAINLRQWVYLKRNPNIHLTGTTWYIHSMGTVGEDRTSQIREAIKDDIDIFINDYLSVNPKGGK